MPIDTATTGRYDVIIIGSGIGGMTSAALLAKLKASRVLVVERHFAAGGQSPYWFFKIMNDIMRRTPASV